MRGTTKPHRSADECKLGQSVARTAARANASASCLAGAGIAPRHTCFSSCFRFRICLRKSDASACSCEYRSRSSSSRRRTHACAYHAHSAARPAHARRRPLLLRTEPTCCRAADSARRRSTSLRSDSRSCSICLCSRAGRPWPKRNSPVRTRPTAKDRLLFGRSTGARASESYWLQTGRSRRRSIDSYG